MFYKHSESIWIVTDFAVCLVTDNCMKTVDQLGLRKYIQILASSPANKT